MPATACCAQQPSSDKPATCYSFRTELIQHNCVAAELLVITELLDGVINMVFAVHNTQTGSSVLLKQALPYVRAIGPSMPLSRVGWSGVPACQYIELPCSCTTACIAYTHRILCIYLSLYMFAVVCTTRMACILSCFNPDSCRQNMPDYCQYTFMCILCLITLGWGTKAASQPLLVVSAAGQDVC